MQQTREIYRQDRDRLVELAFDQGRTRHLVLPVHKAIAWCGAKVTEPRSKRKREAPDKLPSFLCAACMTAFDAMRADLF